MQFDTPATTNPIDRLKVIGRPIPRIDGQLKTTGRAMYAYEWHDSNVRCAYGYPLGAAIAKGRIKSMDISAAKKAPGVLAVVTALDAGKRKKGKYNTANLFGGDEVQHYHQAIAVVVAETFEQARAASVLIKVAYTEEKGSFDLKAAMDTAVKPEVRTAGFGGGRFRRRLQGRSGRSRRNLHHSGPITFDDGTARVDCRMGWRRVDRLDVEPDDRLVAVRPGDSA